MMSHGGVDPPLSTVFGVWSGGSVPYTRCRGHGWGGVGGGVGCMIV